ncbi:MAG: Gfo/Idh/MocA family protein [Phycisphaerae bacterium]
MAKRSGRGRKRIRVGIVGMGIRGRMYAAIAKGLPEVELVGVCDLAAKARRAAAKSLDVGAYASADELCKRARPDAVVIATPDFAHVEPAVAAAAAGADLLIEKPLAMNVADGRTICRAVEQAGVRAMVAFENHWNPPLAAMKAAADAGELGRLASCVSQLDDRIDVPTGYLPWLGRSSPGWFLMSHTVELAGWIAGQRPVRVWASGRKETLAGRGIDTYDAIHAVIEFDGGMVGSFNSCWILPRSLPLIFQFRHEMVGTKGSMRADLTDQMLHKAVDRYEHPSTIGVSMTGAMTSPPALMFCQFVEAMRTGAPSPCPLADGLVNVAAIAGVHESIATGRPVDVRV